MPPLLTIITRTFRGRPGLLRRCRASVRDQSRFNLVEHLMFIDHEKRGVEWSYDNLNLVVPSIHGDYVMLLDDDDYLIAENFVECLERDVTTGGDVYIYRMDMGNGLILPPIQKFGVRPELGKIACSCFVVKREVWISHVFDFGPYYDGDYRFISKLWDDGCSFRFIDQAVSRVGVVSRGAAEDGAAHPIGLETEPAGGLPVQPFGSAD